MKKTTTISIIAVGLIFLYWYNKRSSRYALQCADVWDNLKNKDARNIFFNALGLTENDPDIKDNLTQQAQQSGNNIDFVKCKWAVKYLATHEPSGVINEPPIINGAEETRVSNCMCSKFNS